MWFLLVWPFTLMQPLPLVSVHFKKQTRPISFMFCFCFIFHKVHNTLKEISSSSLLLLLLLSTTLLLLLLFSYATVVLMSSNKCVRRLNHPLYYWISREGPLSPLWYTSLGRGGMATCSPTLNQDLSGARRQDFFLLPPWNPSVVLCIKHIGATFYELYLTKH